MVSVLSRCAPIRKASFARSVGGGSTRDVLVCQTLNT